ncbi:hypothetical protein PVAP13_1NG275319 [Panicum virgatum]|uniref:Uncharacterized protein n=1 Tax=Panicum virgatum TaxID=38727 RepID=A0A8T0WQ67_PANVG|nr:hypothetical protein PVAP13_1NG275319 [Panicum virgatum]
MREKFPAPHQLPLPHHPPLVLAAPPVAAGARPAAPTIVSLSPQAAVPPATVCSASRCELPCLGPHHRGHADLRGRGAEEGEKIGDFLFFTGWVSCSKGIYS